MKLKCHVCESDVIVPDKTKAGERITCTNCFAQLGLYKIGGKLILGCAICKEPVFDSNGCARCERNRERKAILEEGKL